MSLGLEERPKGVGGHAGAEWIAAEWRDWEESKGVRMAGDREGDGPSKMLIVVFVSFFRIQHKIHTGLAIQRTLGGDC